MSFGLDSKYNYLTPDLASMRKKFNPKRAEVTKYFKECITLHILIAPQTKRSKHILRGLNTLLIIELERNTAV